MPFELFIWFSLFMLLNPQIKAAITRIIIYHQHTVKSFSLGVDMIACIHTARQTEATRPPLGVFKYHLTPEGGGRKFS